jgi:hypothetical protein
MYRKYSFNFKLGLQKIFAGDPIPLCKENDAIVIIEWNNAGSGEKDKMKCIFPQVSVLLLFYILHKLLFLLPQQEHSYRGYVFPEPRDRITPFLLMRGKN